MECSKSISENLDLCVGTLLSLLLQELSVFIQVRTHYFLPLRGRLGQILSIVRLIGEMPGCMARECSLDQGSILSNVLFADSYFLRVNDKRNG